MRKLFEEKDFRKHLEIFNSLIDCRIPFAFNRFSDGELFMIRNKSIQLSSSGGYIDGKKVNNQSFLPWDQKSFDPKNDTSIIKDLWYALQQDSNNYLLGLPCPCCASPHDVDFLRKNSRSSTTWANLLLNANYGHFIETTLPKILVRPIHTALNHVADLSLFSMAPETSSTQIPDNVLQHMDHVEQQFFNDCSYLVNDTVVLVGASAAAKILIAKGNKIYPNLTFIDVGTTLNPLIRLGLGRDYLASYWKKNSPTSAYANRVCIW